MGIVGHLRRAGIEYRWLVELGNPQKTDPAMSILRDHIVTFDDSWPVNRGMKLLKQLVEDEGRRCCLLCACEKYDECHRRVVAESLNQRYFGGALLIAQL